MDNVLEDKILWPTEAPKNKIKVACAYCKKKHIACTGGRPCDQCIRRNQEEFCVDSVRKRLGRPPKLQKISHDAASSITDSDNHKIGPKAISLPNVELNIGSEGGFPLNNPPFSAPAATFDLTHFPFDIDFNAPPFIEESCHVFNDSAVDNSLENNKITNNNEFAGHDVDDTLSFLTKPVEPLDFIIDPPSPEQKSKKEDSRF